MPATVRTFVRCLTVVACLPLAAGSLPAAEPTAPAEATSLAVDLLGRDDPEFRAIGLDGVRYGIRGPAATREFADLLAAASAPRQAELMTALAERGDATALPAIAAVLAATRDQAVRAAAIAALGGLGGAAEVAPLVTLVGGEDRAAAVPALIAIQGPEAAAAIVAAARAATPAARAVLYDVLAARRERAAIGDLVASAAAEDAVVRAAAMRTLAVLGGPEEVPGLVAGVLAAPAGGERDAAERALLAVCRRDGTGPTAITRFLEAFEAATATDREALVPALGRIGGPAALAIVDGLVAAPAPEKRALGLKALARWPDADVAGRLLDMIDKAPDAADRELLLGALIRIAPLPDNKLDDRKRLELLSKAFGLCRSDADRIKVLDRADAIRTIETLRFVVPHLDTPALAEAACGGVVELAHHRGLRDAHKEEFTRALDKVLATTANAETRDRAERYKQGRTWERKKPGG
jgi:HEAT repeat protein